MATKKAKTEVNPLSAIYDICPYFSQSDFERDNFNISTGVSYPRFIIDTVNRIRKIDSDLETEKRTFERNVLLDEKQQLETLLSNEDQSKIEVSLKNWQQVEQEYWVNHLGKIAAIEVLTIGKPSLETMNKLVKLPEDAYITATQICVRLANAIKGATVRAEEAIGVKEQNQTAPAETPTTPKKMSLRKVK